MSAPIWLNPMGCRELTVKPEASERANMLDEAVAMPH